MFLISGNKNLPYLTLNSKTVFFFGENPAIQAKTHLRIMNSVGVYRLLPKTDLT